MDLRFDNKVALVVGAAGGIGFATAKAFAEAGAKVVIADINQEGIMKAAETLRNQGHKAVGVVCDVAVEEQVRLLVEKVVEAYRGLDVAYNNVGIQAPVAKITEADGRDFDRVVAVNLRGMWNCLKYELIQMEKQGRGGAIVNCSSQCGIVGTAGLGAYTASKHGVAGLTKVVALEYARQNIRINAICPGCTDTEMVRQAVKDYPEHMAKTIDAIPLGRMASTEEIASAVLWLCSDYGGFSIGQVMPLDGGYAAM